MKEETKDEKIERLEAELEESIKDANYIQDNFDEISDELMVMNRDNFIIELQKLPIMTKTWLEELKERLESNPNMQLPNL